MSKQSRRVRKEKFDEKREDNTPVLVPKNEKQRSYLRSLYDNQITISTGPSGCGKTMVPSHKAAEWLAKGEIEKIVVARPNVSMGRTLGFRPGSVQEKLMPWVNNMLIHMRNVLGSNYQYMEDKGIIELQALEDLRGRSWDDRMLIIVDEVQNTYPEEIKSIVTRLGEDAKLVLCGDPKQTDIRGQNGLDYIQHIVEKYGIPSVGVIEFTSDDIVRSDLVKQFVMAFEKEHGRN